MSAKNKIYNLIILDESGSMESIKPATIQGFNELMQSIQFEAEKDAEMKQYVQFFSFNSNGIIEQIKITKASQLTLLDENRYRPNAMTPLYDAIGHAVSKLRFALEKEKDYAVLVTILTDGAENASKEYTRITIANMIRELEKQNWVFTYIGAHADAGAEAQDINIGNFISITNNCLSVTTEMDKEKSRRKRFYDHVKLGAMGKLSSNYFEPGADEIKDTGTA